MQWDTTPPADLKAKAEAGSAAAKMTEDANRVFASYGMRVDAREIATRYQIPMLATELPAAAPAGERPLLSLVPDQDGENEEGEGVVTEDASAALAAKMTEHRVERCEHGSLNRCWLCGVERVRDFELGEDGSTQWGIAWRPIAPRVAA